MKVTVDRDLCIGCGNCESIAPNVFELDSEGIATVIDPEGDDESVIREAAESCPEDAIILQDEDGEQIYP